MRKWMRDRLQRGKKKPAEQGSQPAAPPLQPAYFDAEQTPTPSPESSHNEAEASAPHEPAFEAQPAGEESGPETSQPRSQASPLEKANAVAAAAAAVDAAEVDAVANRR